MALRYTSTVCLALLAIGASAQVEVGPCHGRTSGFAADINSCESFWRCDQSTPTRGVCPNGGQFDGELERCVAAGRNPSPCFRCRRHFELVSVPNACSQYAQCFNFRPTLHACPRGLVFDGVAEQCNRPPPGGGCRRGNNHGGTTALCPQVSQQTPLFLRGRESCTRYVYCINSHMKHLVL